MSLKQDQAQSTLKRSIAQVLERQVADPRIRGLVSVTDVSISPDRRRATVKVSVMPEQYEARTIAGLNAAAGHIQSKVKKLVSMRVMPMLTFELDSSLKRQAEVFEAIRDGLERENPESQSEESES